MALGAVLTITCRVLNDPTTDKRLHKTTTSTGWQPAPDSTQFPDSSVTVLASNRDIQFQLTSYIRQKTDSVIAIQNPEHCCLCLGTGIRSKAMI